MFTFPCSFGHHIKFAILVIDGTQLTQDRESTDIFGAHYDEGRITRAVDRDPTWGTLARRSIANYRELEQLSGQKTQLSVLTR